MCHEIDQAEKVAPAIVKDETLLSAISLESPNFKPVEADIEQYYKRYSKLVDSLEEDYEHPSRISNQEHFCEETKAHRGLAKAISKLTRAESLHPTLAIVQANLQSAMKTDSEVLTAMQDYTEEYYESLNKDSKAIHKAALDVPSVISDFLCVSMAEGNNVQLADAVSGISHQLLSLPITVDHEVHELISSISTIAPSIKESLESCYPTLYQEASEVAYYVISHETVESALSSFLSAAESVQSLSTAISSIISQQQSTVCQDISLIDTMHQSWPTATTALSFEQMLVESSDSLNTAAHQLQESFYQSPATAWSLLIDIEDPAKDTNPQKMQYLAQQHPSFVQAVKYETSWVAEHPSYRSEIVNLAPNVITELEVHSSLVSVLSSLSRIISSSVAAASASVGKVRSAVPSITTVMQTFQSIEVYDPSITCDEAVIASYDSTEPTLVSEIWEALTDPHAITDMQVISQETAENPSLMSAFHNILKVEHHHSSLQSVQSALIVAEETDSSFTYQWSTYTEAEQSILSTLSYSCFGYSNPSYYS